MASATLAFAQGFTDATYKLIEVDDSLLQELFADDGSVNIKGTDTDEAVLTTRDKSFVVRLADSSNTMLLVRGPVELSLPASAAGSEMPEGTIACARTVSQIDAAASVASEADCAVEAAAPIQIQARAHEHFELVRCAPRLGRAHALLSACPYAGAAADDELCRPPTAEFEEALAPNRPDRRPTLAKLEMETQCSAHELHAAMQRYRAIEVRGRWCILDPQFETDVVESILALAVEQDWPLDAIPLADAVSHLEPQMDETAVRHCVRTHSTAAFAPWDEWCAAATQAELALDPRAISRFRARAMLLETAAWPKDVFYEAWADGLPNGVEVCDADLEGQAVLLPADACAGSTVRALPVESMPASPAVRFGLLFGVKPAWSMRELVPYVTEMVAPGKTAEALVLQYARCVVANDGTYTYVARA